jgi:putative ABC transport system permease protein
MIGRVFTNEEVGPGRPNLVVLTHDLWQRRFTADRNVIGKQVQLSGAPYTVIGVMGPDFHFMRHSSLGAPTAADAYIALSVNLAQTNPGSGAYAGLIRVRPGTSPRQVSAAVSAVSAMVDRRDFQGKGLRLWPVGMKTDLVAAVRPALVVLGAAGTLLVLVLTINLANLLLVRAAQRDQEFAILRALGADQFALFRATLLEAGFLGFGGGVCGLVAAWWATRALVGLAPLDLPRREAIHLDWRVALVVITISTALGLLAGAVPAVWATRSKLATLLRNASVRGGGAQGRLRRSLVVAQVALSLVLLTAGGLVARSFERLLSARPGFDPSGVLTLRVPIPASRYPGDTAVVAIHDRLLEAFSAIPGVRAVGGASALPLTADASQMGLGFPGAPGNTGQPDKDRPLVDYMAATNGYFDTMKIHIVAGSGFSTARTRATTRELLIDRQLAEQFFPKSSPIGFRVPIGNDTATIVGVFEQPRMYDVHQEGRPQLYFRDDFGAERGMSFVLRTERTPASLEPEVRAAVHRIDPQLAVAEMKPMDQIVSDTLRQPRVSAVLLAGFSLGALLLAAMGLYGVVAGSVNRRRHEMAIRLALGSGAARVLRLVLWEGVLLVVLGLVLGVPGIYLASHVLRGLLVGVSPFDPLTLIAVAAGLLLVALLACYIPARRVVGIDPAHSLREG